MSESKSRPNPTGVVSVIGATATGKTSLGIGLARRFNGEVVNADSRLFYRGMDIGTAKPTEAERQGISHHLIDILDPHQSYSLSEFLKDAVDAISNITGRGKLPIVVGGTGQYIWGLLEGWEVPNIPPNPALREELETQLKDQGVGTLQTRLYATGAHGVEKVEILNPRRLIRAIERAVATGDAMGGASKSAEPPYDAMVIGLNAPRELLHVRVEKRVDQMFIAGWRDEVEKLVQEGVTRNLPSMSAIGYRELVDHVEGRMDWPAIRDEILIGNHRLIGAQNNWFKTRDERISWIGIADCDYVDKAIELVGEWLSKRGESCIAR